MSETKTMFDLLDERQRKEIEFARLYASNFRHGTAGHNQYMLIATLASFVEVLEQRNVELQQALEGAGK